ncbi:Coiled-coil and C2 domain-containing protein 2A [Papilio machaon]|uniref:Coiled-coil and C2 domain-containing protein 2A n=1 Tax=Papilio machaon TaxID=76193 RepID=A0A0N0PER3_PAPMA|nr:Coiled-coil and C2 domain-containing protein 2A [Papilio machaon]
MSKNIELKHYCVTTYNESDSEQYHEIDQDALVKETTFTISPSSKHINAYDFFTQHNVKTKEKSKGKKRKAKNNKSSSIMDIINSELTSATLPIRENVIEFVNHDKLQNVYHKTATLKMLKWHHSDVERGRKFTNPVKLSPTFPKVLENTSAKEFPVGVHYSDPVMFNVLMADYTADDGLIQSQKFLDFEILNMKFIHHYKFSLETLLIVKLIDCYNEYLSIENSLKELCRNIKISRETKNNLRQQLLKISDSNKDGVRFDATLLKYTRALFYYKDAYMEMLKKEKEIVHKILSLWSDVEMVREKTNRTEVNYYLEINKIPITKDDYERDWNNAFEMEYLDLLDKIEFEYANAYLEYKENKSKYNSNGVEKKNINKPKLVIDEVKIKADTETLVDRILEKNKIEITLKCKKHMKDLLKPVHVLGSNDYYFKIYVDDVFVCQSEMFTFKDFVHSLDISETFSVQILPKNKILIIILYENDIQVSSTDLSIEEIKKNITQADVKPYNFTYADYVIPPSNKYVGSGFSIKEIATENKVRLKSGNLFKGKLNTACEVNMKIGWNEKFNKNSHEAVLNSIQVEKEIKRYLNGVDKPNINNLIQIINYLYDRNIENDEKVINSLTKICRIRVKNDYAFAIDENSDESIRLRLLLLRNKGGFVNVEKKLVPLFSSQISTEQLSTLQRTNRLIDLHNFDDSEDIDTIDLQRYLGLKYIQGLNENLQRTVNEFLLQKTHRDVVKDFKDLSLRGILSNQSNLMSMSISSHVTRNQIFRECESTEQEIRATVLRAFNLPDRAVDLLTENDDEDIERIAGFKVRPLRPYVRLSYHGTSAQSAPGIGCYPSWNQTLKIRTKNKGGFVNVEKKLVPLFSSQISTEQLSTLQRTNRLIDLHNFDDSEDIDPIDLQRYLGLKYIQGLNENLQRTVNEFLLQKTHRDVVKDFKDLSLRGILSNQSNLMSMSISSHVTRNQILRECESTEQEIQATVLRAFNLPDRAADLLTENDDEDTERIAGFKVRPLRPYVRLSYHGTSAQSAPGIGCYPSWNQTLKIRTKFSPLSSIHVNVYDECKVSARSMQEVSGSEQHRCGRWLAKFSPLSSIHVNVYDECKVSARSVQEASGSEQHRCGRWLAKLVLPLTTVLNQGTLRGTFKLTTPPLLIGYENSSEPKEARSLIPQVKRMIKKEISFLTLQITTSLSHLGEVQTYTQPIPNVSNDDRTIKHLNDFLTGYLNEFPSRSISLTYVGSSGKNTCVTEFLQPIPIPDLEWFPKNPKRPGSALSKSSGHSKSSSKSSGKTNELSSPLKEEKVNAYSGFDESWRSEDSQLSKALNFCIRYVALIPTYEVPGTPVVTLTGSELLQVLNGSPTDHTILLASYFLHLGIKCWVVTGLALPRGLSTYLLVKYDLITRKYTTGEDQVYKSRGFFKKSDDFVWHVYDAVSGEQFELRDVACPLKTVFFVFDEYNIWVNIQSSQDCQTVSFDFSKSSDWQQVFDTPRQFVSQPVRCVREMYRAPSDVCRLQDLLEAKLMTKVQKWRPRTKTVWNRYCCTLLRETLPQWEFWSFDTTDRRPEPGHRLKQLMATYKIFGFPLNMHYINTKSVLANVKATSVHVNDDPNVEFALAVQMYAYPNNVISLWVYLASITRI